MKCQSCGRTSNESYCAECLDASGKLRGFDEIVSNLMQYFVDTQGFDRDAAKSAAIGVLSRQPAWERHVSRESRKREASLKQAYILMSIVLALTSSGLVYWLATPRPANSKVTFENISSRPASPFDEIIEKEINGLQVFELRCPGDQELLQLTGNILTFKSLEGTKNSKYSRLYNIDLDEMQGFPFDPKSLETRTLLSQMDGSLVIPKEGENSSGAWVYYPHSGELKEVGGRFSQWNQWYWANDDCKEIKIFDLNSLKEARYPSNDYLYDSMLIGRKILTLEGDDCFVRDLQKGMKKKMSAVNAMNSFNNLKGEGDFLAINPYGYTKYVGYEDFFNWAKDNNLGLSVYDVGRDKTVEIDKRSARYAEITATNDPTRTWIYYMVQDVKNPENSCTYYKNISRPLRSPGTISVEGKQVYPVTCQTGQLLFSTSENSVLKSRSQRKGDKLFDLWVFDPMTGIRWQLDEGKTDQVLMSRDHIVWTRWNGKNDDQFFNICIAKIPPQDFEPDECASEENPKLMTVDAMKLDGLEVSQIRREGFQKIDRAIVQRDIQDYEYIFFTESAGRNENPRSFVFDPNTGKGEIFEPDSNETLRFLSRKKTSFEFVNDIGRYKYKGDKVEILYESLLSSPLYDLRIDKAAKAVIYTDPDGMEHRVMNIDDLDISLFHHDHEPDLLISFGMDEHPVIYHFNARKPSLAKVGDWFKNYVCNDRFVATSDYCSLSVYDKDTGKSSTLSPNISKIGKNLSQTVKINDSKSFEKLLFAWEYPDYDTGRPRGRIAYQTYSRMDQPLKELDYDTQSGLKLDGILGDWIFFHEFDFYMFEGDVATLKAFNTVTGNILEVDDRYIPGTMARIGKFVYWSTQNGYQGKQYTNISFARAR